MIRGVLGLLLSAAAALAPENSATVRDDNWHYTFGLEENSGWIGHNGMIPGYFTFEVYNPELDATIVTAMNTDKKVNGEQGINVLLRDISKILFPDNPVNVPVIK
jgi:D-alanyl-D-alanine carboxypeptidase